MLLSRINDVTGTLLSTGSDTVAVIPKAIAPRLKDRVCAREITTVLMPLVSSIAKRASPLLCKRVLNEQDQLTPGFATSNKQDLGRC